MSGSLQVRRTMQLKVGVSMCLSMWRILLLIMLQCYCGIYARKCNLNKEGCGRVAVTPSPIVSPTTSIKTINGSVRGIACTSSETKRTGCLNGGTCFVLVIGKDRKPSCHCSPDYMGMRCDELNILNFTTKEKTIAKAGIAVSIGVLVVIIIAFVAVAIVYYRRRKQERRTQAQKKICMRYTNANGGSLLLPENHIEESKIDLDGATQEELTHLESGPEDEDW